MLPPLPDPMTVVRPDMGSEPTVPVLPAVRFTVTPAAAWEKSATLLDPLALNVVPSGFPATKVVFPPARPSNSVMSENCSLTDPSTASPAVQPVPLTTHTARGPPGVKAKLSSLVGAAGAPSKLSAG